jgi:amino-acid N-acetyltransferase
VSCSDHERLPEVPTTPSDGVQIRKAVIDDVPRLTGIINSYASAGIMLPRSQHQVYQSLRDFAVAVCENEVIGCGALHIVWADLCEVRSLAVAAEWAGRGVGRRIVQHLLDEARTLGLPRVFALTYRDRFFASLGFRVVSHELLPHKIWGDCLNCPKYPNCDEIAMMLDLAEDRSADGMAGSATPTGQETFR